MNKEALEESVIEFIATACNLDRNGVTPQTRILDLGLDSLSLATIAGQLESHYQREFTEEQLLSFFNAQAVTDLVDLTRKLTA